MSYNEMMLDEILNEYFNDLEEWPAFRLMPNVSLFTGEKPAAIPMFIRECGRLVPNYTKDSIHPEFYPWNMQDIKVPRIQLLGMIECISEYAPNLTVNVYDGTGTISVVIKSANYEEACEIRKRIDAKHNVKPADLPMLHRLITKPTPNQKKDKPAIEQRERLLQRYDRWLIETKQGRYGTEVKEGDYITIVGYCTLRKETNDQRMSEIVGNLLSLGHVIPLISFTATSIKILSEKQYNTAFRNWFNKTVKRRYTAE